MATYTAQNGSTAAPEVMDKKYLVNALIASVRRITYGGKNASKDDLQNVEVLKNEIIRRLGKK